MDNVLIEGAMYLRAGLVTVSLTDGRTRGGMDPSSACSVVSARRFWFGSSLLTR